MEDKDSKLSEEQTVFWTSFCSTLQLCLKFGWHIALHLNITLHQTKILQVPENFCFIHEIFRVASSERKASPELCRGVKQGAWSSQYERFLIAPLTLITIT